MVVGPFRQSMKAIALPMVLLMLTATLAGCTGGDPDGGDGTDGIDLETLNQLIEDNLEDFLNNTSVTVNQDFHYYNNTTTTNENTDNSVSNINGSGVGSTSTMQMFTVNWNHADGIQIIDYGSRIVTLNDTLQQTSGEPDLLYALVYNGNLIEFRDVNCEQFYSYSQLDDNDWEDYLMHNYQRNDDDWYELGAATSDLEDFWQQNGGSYGNSINADGESVHQQCRFNSNEYGNVHYPVVFQIQLSVGQVLDFLSLLNLHNIMLECDDGYTGSSNNGSLGNYLGGQANCTVSGIVRVTSYHHYGLQYDFQTEAGSSANNSSGNNSDMDHDLSNIPDWWEWEYWYFYENGTSWSDMNYDTYSSTPLEFVVYFRTYFVEVYDLDSQ